MKAWSIVLAAVGLWPAQVLLAGEVVEDSKPVLTLAARPPRPIIEDHAGGGHLSIGPLYKHVDSKWGSAQDRVGIMLDAELQPEDSYVSIIGQALYSYSSSVPDAAGASGDYSNTYGLNLGVRVVFENVSAIQPFIHGGASVAAATAKSNPDAAGVVHKDTGGGGGGFVGGGFYWNVSPDVHVGLLAQYTHAKVHLFGEKLNAGGIDVMFMIGAQW